MKKRILAAVLTLAMMFSLAVSASAANNVIRTEDVKISVDGKTIDVPQGSIWISEDGYTMVGARALAEGFGAKIVWDSATLISMPTVNVSVSCRPLWCSSLITSFAAIRPACILSVA